MTLSRTDLPAERRAARRATIALWLAGYGIFVLLLAASNRFQGPLTIGLIAVQCASAVIIAMGLIEAVLRSEAMSLPRRSAMIAVAYLTCVMVQGGYDLATNYLFDIAIVPAREVPQVNWQEYLRSCFLFVFVYAANLALINFAIVRVRVGARDRELVEVRAQAAQAQLAMLRYQLNPHFLFNTLNAISSLVVTGRAAQAEEMLARLSSFLRASLESDADDFVSLDAELAVVQEYLEIESVRFGDRLRTDFAIAAEVADLAVPSFILQPLVENAIKYAVSPSRSPVTVKIEARRDGRDLVVAVTDDGAAATETGCKSGTGVGLRNIRGRLAAIYGTDASLEAVSLERGFVAIVRMPALATNRAAVPVMMELAAE